MEKLNAKRAIDGRLASPVLPEGVKNYLIDIDGTICDDVPNEEPERMKDCAHYPDALETCNRWYNEGHIITFLRAELRICGKSPKPGSKVGASSTMDCS